MALSTENVEAPMTRPAAAAGLGPIRLLKSTILRGCNVYHEATVIRQRVDFGGFTALSSSEAGSGFARRFIERFFGLQMDTTEGHLKEAFQQRLNSATGVPLEEALLEAILAVDASMTSVMRKPRTPAFAQIVQDKSQGLTALVWGCDEPGISRLAAGVGLAGFVELLPESLYPHHAGSAGTFATALAALRKRASGRQWSNAAARLVRAARERGVPCEPLGGAYLRVGQGVAQQVVYAPNAAKSLFSPSHLARSNRMTNRPLDAGGPTVSTQNRDHGPVLDLAFPPGISARIPIAMIAGERRTTPVARGLETLLRACGKTVGLATCRGSSVDGEPVEPGARHPEDAARFLLHDPRVEMLVGTTSPRRVVQRGLRLDACEVTAIMNPSIDGDIEPYQRGVDVMVRATNGMLVVSAGNSFAIDVIHPLDPQRVILLSRRLDPGIRKHLAAGGVAVVRARQAGDEYVELHRAGETLVRQPVLSIKPLQGAVSMPRIQARMFAVALAFGLGLSREELKSAAMPEMRAATALQ